jgi:hypothetical protein
MGLLVLPMRERFANSCILWKYDVSRAALPFLSGRTVLFAPNHPSFIRVFTGVAFTLTKG